jgi:ABC-2 type transport system permease protein
MNGIYIALNSIKMKIRDKKTFTRSMLLPIVLILILGNALKSTDVFSVRDFGKTTVYYLNNDNKDISKSFDTFLKNKEIKDILEVKSVSSYDEGVKLVNDEKATALIYINKDYSNNIENNKKAKIQLYESKSDTVRNSIVENVIDSYNTGANTIMSSSKISNAKASYVTTENVDDNYLSIDGKSPRAIDYYAVTMLVLTLMYGTSYGCVELEELFFKKVGRRIKTTGTGTLEHLAGVILGEIFFLVLQAVALILFTKYVYGANWGSNPFTILTTMVALSALAIGIGVMVGVIMGDVEKASGLLRIIVPVFTFVSGGYYKIPMGNSVILNYIPNNLSQTALFNTIYGGSRTAANSAIITMFVMAAIALIIAGIFGRRKLA